MGSDYESVIRQRICEPLNMTDTWVSLPPRLSDALARPQLRSGRPCSNWDIGALAGAGGLRSTVNDLLIFLNEHLAPSNPQLRSAIEMALTERVRMSDGMSIGLGWHCRKRADREVRWHNGATGGHTAFIGMQRKEQVGVVVLGNADFWREVTLMGRRFLAALSTLADRDTVGEPGVPRDAAAEG